MGSARGLMQTVLAGLGLVAVAWGGPVAAQANPARPGPAWQNRVELSGRP